MNGSGNESQIAPVPPTLPINQVKSEEVPADMWLALRVVMRLQRQAPPMLPVPRNGYLPLSFAQERLWFLNEFEPNSSSYNATIVCHFTGCLNVATLQQSFNEIVRRHEVLRTTFAKVNGQPSQIIAPALNLTLPVVNFHEFPTEVEVTRLVTEEAQRPFNLNYNPLLRVTLLRLSEEKHVMVLSMHLIVCDGWSVGVLFQELALLYKAYSTEKPLTLPELPIQYADFAVWQRQWLQGKVLETLLSYWQQQLGSSLPSLQLPTDRPRQAVPNFQSARQTLALPKTLTQPLKELSRREGVTLFTTLLAAFLVFLYQYTEQEDLFVSSLLANRNRVEIQELIGYFSNVVVLRANLSGNPSFQELLGRVRQVVSGAYAHQDLPVQRLADFLNLAHTPLSRVIFVLNNSPKQPIEIPGLTLESLDVNTGAMQSDLFLFLEEEAEQLIGGLKYNPDLFDAATITRIIGHFQTLLESTVVDPQQRLSELPLLTFDGKVKVNYDALPAPDIARPELEDDLALLQTPIEAVLAEIWAEVLRLEQVTIHDNFFELGGNSLLSTQLISRIRDSFQVELPLRQLFESPTVVKLAQAIEVARQAEPSTTVSANTVTVPDADTVLDATISAEAVFEQVTEPTNIFLTGGTGFLGAFLLYELLEQSQADIYCLVRSANAEEGKRKIQRNLESYLLWNESLNSRIIPVPGDLSQPLLGFSEQQFQMMVSKVDVIYHNGAMVNIVYPYSALRETNVLGTQEILRLASQNKTKPVHFISTLAIFSSISYSEAHVVREQNSLNSSQGLNSGYTQSKWVAEKLVTIARSRGIPVCIYRPGAIAGHSLTGVCNRDDFVCRMIKGCVQLGYAPEIDMILDMTAVDYVSKAVVHLSKQKSSLGKTFHLLNSHPIHWNDLINWIRSFGYPIQQIPYERWRTELLNLAGHFSENALSPLLPFFEEMSSQARMPQIDCQNTLNGLTGTNIVCPPVDTELLHTYFSYFIRSNFLNAP